MSQFNNVAKHGSDDSKDEIDSLTKTIEDIGLARFIGRINAGVVDPDAGLTALNSFVEKEAARPLISRVAHFLLCKEDSYKNQ
ncbi:hypothetical protein [Methyloversatilis discipulorum]|uniref:hypothetical protein n=1 Tax=Methyloversatilis discipulorum TaxID=1119528 RepID=UPI0012FB5B21|nr:hypothetical protein [Methyloversatilis discipulorum]